MNANGVVMDSGVPSLYVDVHPVSMGFMAYLWVVKHIFKFIAEICCNPVKEQSDQRLVTRVHLSHRRRPLTELS